jgi:hypothetical protein
MTLATPSSKQIAGAAVCAAIVLALPVVFPVEHHFPWDAIPGFYAIYGAVGCGALVVFGKWLGRVLVVKPEGWYGGDDDRTEEPS